MKHAKPSRAWRPVRARTTPRGSQGAWTALLFNVCLLLLPAAAAAGLYVMSRDHLYAYQFSDAGGRAVRTRIEDRLGDLIMLDFDRQRQWEDLIGMELTAGDVAAARGFLLSGRRMLPARDASQIERQLRADSTDADVELAALDIVAPSVRARYEATVPLLSRRAASGPLPQHEPAAVSMLGDQSDFELLARALLADPSSDPTHLVLTGFGLGLAGELTPRQRAGASALAMATRREDYPQDFHDAITGVLSAAMPPTAFRAAALASANGGDAGAFDNAAAAFQASVTAARVAAAKAALDEIGAMSEATSATTASMLVIHAHGLRDLPRLRLVALAGGDRAAAAAKRLPRESNLAQVARGELEVTRDLAAAIALAGLAAAGLLLSVLFVLFQGMRRVWLRMQEDIDGGELIETFNGGWRPL